MAKKKIEKKVEGISKGNSFDYQKQLLIIVSVMVVIIVALVLTPFIAKKMNTFEYQGLTFTKEKLGSIELYHYYYFFNRADGTLVKYNLYLRGDPRENNIPLEGEIVYPTGKAVFVSVNSTGMNECKYAQLAVSGVAMFISGNGLDVLGATPDKQFANETGLKYADCGTAPNNVIVKVQRGSESKIERTDARCYVITAASCEDILPATEKFILQTVIDAKARDAGQ